MKKSAKIRLVVAITIFVILCEINFIFAKVLPYALDPNVKNSPMAFGSLTYYGAIVRNYPPVAELAVNSDIVQDIFLQVAILIFLVICWGIIMENKKALLGCFSLLGAVQVYDIIFFLFNADMIAEALFSLMCLAVFATLAVQSVISKKEQSRKVEKTFTVLKYLIIVFNVAIFLYNLMAMFVLATTVQAIVLVIAQIAVMYFYTALTTTLNKKKKAENA